MDRAAEGEPREILYLVIIQSPDRHHIDLYGLSPARSAADIPLSALWRSPPLVIPCTCHALGNRGLCSPFKTGLCKPVSHAFEQQTICGQADILDFTDARNRRDEMSKVFSDKGFAACNPDFFHTDTGATDIILVISS